ncbi:MAG: hypothetical protein ACRCT8_11875 [Lacipirellulaceae bacterium]
MVALRSTLPLVLVCLAPLVFADDKPSEAPPIPVIADEPKSVDAARFVPTELAPRATVRFDEAPLEDVVAWLTKERGLTVLVDAAALDELGIGLDEPVTDHLDDQPVYLLLDRLKSLELAWRVEDGIVHVTSDESAEQTMSTRPHNVADLLDQGLSADEVIDAIISTIGPDGWAQNGGGQAELTSIGDVLFVLQNDGEQRHVEAFLAGLRKHGRQTFVNEPAEHVALREKLSAKVSVQFDDTRLSEAVERLAKDTGVDIRLDAGVRPRESVTLALVDRKLETVLHALTLQEELAWRIDDGVLWISSADDAPLKVAFYDVRDLVQDKDEFDSLVDAIVSQVAVDSWAENGGGEAEVRPIGPGTLAISQTEPMHAKVLALLEQYRAALRVSKPRDVPDADAEVLTVHYRLDAEVAREMQNALPTLVRAETWKSDKRPDAVGEIALFASSPRKSAPLLRDSGVFAVTPQAVLRVVQTRGTHYEVAKLLRSMTAGDPWPREQVEASFGGGGGIGGMGGGMGGGSFGEPSDAFDDSNAAQQQQRARSRPTAGVRGGRGFGNNYINQNRKAK